jgi:hypothetical protein
VLCTLAEARRAYMVKLKTSKGKRGAATVQHKTINRESAGLSTQRRPGSTLRARRCTRCLRPHSCGRRPGRARPGPRCCTGTSRRAARVRATRESDLRARSRRHTYTAATDGRARDVLAEPNHIHVRRKITQITSKRPRPKYGGAHTIPLSNQARKRTKHSK